MPALTIDQLRPGHVLQEDVVNLHGRRLAAAGTVLTEAHLRTFKTWGVHTVQVHPSASPQETPPPLPEAFLEHARHATKRFFTRNDTRHPLVRQLAHLYYSRVLKQGELPAAPPPIPEGPAITPPPLDQLLGQRIELASLPDIFTRIIEALGKPNASASYLAELIQNDIGLTTRLLKVANSPAFAGPRRVETVSRAIALLGTDQLCRLAFGISLVSLFSHIPQELLDMPQFWRHSIACGILARLLAIQAKMPASEAFFLYGMLHDIGRLIMLTHEPDSARAPLALEARRPHGLLDAERHFWHYDHTQVAAAVLQAWKLPDHLALPVALHHAPGQAPDIPAAAIVHLADALAHISLHGGSGVQALPPLDIAPIERLGLGEGFVHTVMPQLDAHIDEVMHLFFHHAE
ncbi:MAG: putative signal transduction protein [Desulfomicrobiaceae bacterium]|jgi:HD-like signal output (HDOD) protein|nr:putative signal transduction protein [Desulfomicrobiaceae bacterium]MDK2873948.1 hypothetical protein [Desulfomicrobiaceae bacterium]